MWPEALPGGCRPNEAGNISTRGSMQSLQQTLLSSCIRYCARHILVSLVATRTVNSTV